MKVKIVAVGKVKEKYFADAIAEYVKRLGRFCRVEIVEVAEADLKEGGDANVKAALKKEAASILEKTEGVTAVLDLDGRQLSSQDWADFLEKSKAASSVVSFVIGSSFGLDDSVKTVADTRISFGKITLPHTLARVVLCEQIYRAFMINANSTYHK